MIRIDVVIAGIPGLDEQRLADWVARGWVRAEGASRAEWLFAEVDLARLHLLRELEVDLAVDAESLPLVLSLLEQVHGLRWMLRNIIDVLAEAPEDVRRRVFAALTRLDQAGHGGA